MLALFASHFLLLLIKHYIFSSLIVSCELEMDDVHSKASRSYDEVAKARGGEGSQASKETPFRNFNNFVKKSLIQGALDVIRKSRSSSAADPSLDGCVVLDLASGRGGDLMKWLYGQSPPANSAELQSSSTPLLFVARYEGYDISPESVAEAVRRLETLPGKPRTSCQFAVSNCFDPQFWDAMRATNPYFGKFDIISVQFALHYACESDQAVRGLLGSMWSALAPGGVFVATIVDGEELEHRIRSKRTSNSLFRIQLDTECEKWLGSEGAAGSETHLPIGLKYQFLLEGLVDSPEFTIPYPLLLALAQSVGFCEVSSLTYKFRDVISAHARSSGARHSLKGQQLSSDEVELVSLYRTACFRKVARSSE